VSGYTRATWAALSAEVAKLKLRVSILDRKLLELAAAERKYRNRRSNLVGVVGIEGGKTAASVREDPPVTDGEPGCDPDARGHERTQAVANLATVLAEAVLAGDQERARALAEMLRATHARCNRLSWSSTRGGL